MLEVKAFDQAQKSKIHSRYKVSDGVSIINGMVLEQIGKRMLGPVPPNGVIEFEGYMKNKVNNKHVIIFSRAPKLIATPSLRIGDPQEYEKREERGDFAEESKIAEIDTIDISVPQKKVELLSMDNNDQTESNKLNSKDRMLMDSNNPELNPFSTNFNNQDTTASASPNKGEKSQSPQDELNVPESAE